ncbi:interleukin-15 receptor subunit alpha [Anolis sagrei]|uniref:interleukin-15 receptor subunit alpha n=1 Tax=Anolis sagrei TaxID=38937 RepID=UPI003522FD99
MAWTPWMLLLGVLMGWGAFLPASPSEIMEGKCGAPNVLKNARIAEGSSSEKLRYSCVKNYKRKAGTSNLILCKLDSNTKKYQWTKANLTCIRDPSLPSSTTPMSREGKLVWAFVGELGNGTKLRYTNLKDLITQ